MTAIDLDLLPDAVVRLDADRLIVAANAAAAQLAGAVSPDELLGKSLVDVLDPRDLDGRSLLGECWPPAASLRSVVALPDQAVTVKGVGHAGGQVDGQRIQVRVAGRYERDANGVVSGAVLSLRPPRRGRDDHPTGVEVVSTVSHELRSPLTSVKGYTSLLLHRWERLGDEQKRLMLEQVHHDADRVTRLIGELLDISRLETGRLVLRRQLVDLVALGRSVVDKLGVTYPELEASVELPDGFPRVYADPDKLEQVLTNLVENAVKYASPRRLRITGEVLDDAVAVEVHDTGDGIPAADLPRVFRKFFRRDVGRPTGTGLGLWISRGLVEAHGGQLTAASELGKGSTFRFTVPLVDVDALLSGDEP
ncbi:MAG: sensor histidine kinase [Acidimicrobiales bacterium]